METGDLVVIGDSLAAGTLELNLFAEAQRWAYPTHLAERLGDRYVVPELRQVLLDGERRDGQYIPGGSALPDLRSMFGPVLVPAPYNDPALPHVSAKQRPCERHTNLAVPGETLAGAMRGPEGIAAAYHEILHAEPYLASIGGRRVASQLDIALTLDPAPTTIIVELGANDLGRSESGGWSPTDPSGFDADYRELLAALRGGASDARIITMNVPSFHRIASGAPTACEADLIFGAEAGTVARLLDSPPPGSRFILPDLLGFLVGELFAVEAPSAAPRPRPLHTVDLAEIDTVAAAYSRSIERATAEVGGIHVDRASFFEGITLEGLEVKVGGSTHVLDARYGGGLYGYDGLHPTKTLHAAYAHHIIEILNAESSSAMPGVDVDAVAASDKHVVRALGLDGSSSPPRGQPASTSSASSPDP